MLMEANHGLISSHSTTSEPSRLRAPSKRGGGGVSMCGCLHEQPCFEKVAVLSLQAKVSQLGLIYNQ